MIILKQQAGAGSTPLPDLRTLLSANTTYYVDPSTGSDSNAGTSTEDAWETPQHAFDWIAGNIDLGGFSCTLQLADATYTSGVAMKMPIGDGDFIVNGNISTPSNVLFSVTSEHVFVGIGLLGRLFIKNLKMQAATSGVGVWAQACNYVEIENVDIGDCPSTHILISQGTYFTARDYTVSGDSPRHVRCVYGARFMSTSNIITFLNSPVFSDTFLSCASCAMAGIYSNTFTNGGTVTGKRYDVSLNGIVYTNGGGASYLPGSVAGTTATGGQYA